MRGLDPGNEYMVAGDSETIEDTARKHLYIEQEYVLSVMQPKTGPEKIPLRVITFHRDDMLPYDQDVYDLSLIHIYDIADRAGGREHL